MEICDRCKEEPEVSTELCYKCGEELCEGCWGDKTVSVCSKCEKELGDKLEGMVFAHPMMKLFTGRPLTVLCKKFSSGGLVTILGFNYNSIKTWDDCSGNCAAYVVFGIIVFDWLIALARTPGGSGWIEC